jgi:hypothetical protein
MAREAAKAQIGEDAKGGSKDAKRFLFPLFFILFLFFASLPFLLFASYVRKIPR